ncbi:hypothetical protein FFWV33_19090 [Flavobacterium faecale]|uniref:TonB-dependent receptor n=1 Tax=Flavobacterium faecale TaxID=1355330 RepID=A0A2S1LIE1_9FLAO|nr:hypothetical protein [Flavobacterium faecale]AWG23487.1 hypothetical protein FFWV33_19090 [Flavobacterium faecale]
MDNQDKLFNQIKQAAQQAENQAFPGMDKVWVRVDEKLDQEVLVTKTKVWKKLAIAASILLVVSLGYQLTKPKTTFPIIGKPVVVQDSKTNKIIEEKANAPLLIDTVQIKKVIEQQTQVVSTKETDKTKAVALQEVEAKAEELQMAVEKNKLQRQSQAASSSHFRRGKIYEAITVQSAYGKSEPQATVADIQKSPVANAPLVVMNGDLVSSKKYKSVADAKEAITNKYEDEVESLVVLDAPLYIINGVEYDEESLFGQHPTSPYAPLSKQKIESLTVLQNEQAIEKYGQKGKKGVVIIATKNGKPLQQ